jgi:hypothetical protein
MAHTWSEANVLYLQDLSATCAILAQRYKQIHDATKAFQSRIKLPIIVLSSFCGVFSFGNGVFSNASAVSISVGVTNIVIAIGGAVESYFDWSGTITKALKASVEYAALREKIDMELALPEAERELSGVAMVRNAFQEYETITADCPPTLKRLRWVKGAPARVDIESVGSIEPSCYDIKKSVL